jgi:hypothetical protein
MAQTENCSGPEGLRKKSKPDLDDDGYKVKGIRLKTRHYNGWMLAGRGPSWWRVLLCRLLGDDQVFNLGVGGRRNDFLARKVVFSSVGATVDDLL